MDRFVLCSFVVLPMFLGACGDDGGMVTPADGGGTPTDSGMEDAGDPSGDGGGSDDGGGLEDGGGGLCDELSCVNGTCEGEICDCDAGWTGAACDMLNAPADDGVLLWFDADHDASFEVGGFDQVDSWTARVAVNGPVVATPESDDKRPRRLDNQLNGRPTVGFDGVDDTLSSDGDGTTYWNGPDGVDSYTLFAVYQATVESQIAFAMVANTHSLGMAVGTGGRSGQVEALHRDAMAAGGVTPLQLVSLPDAIVLTDYNIVVLRVSETDVTLRVNGEEVANVELESGAIPLNIDQAIVNLGVDSIFYPESRYLGGALAEIIVFSGPLSASVTGAVEDYLGAKWGL